MTDGPTRQDEWEAERQRKDRAARLAALMFVAAALAGLALLAIYVRGGHTQAEGVMLFLAFGAVGLGLGIWVRVVIGAQEVIEDRHLLASDEEARQAFEDVFDQALDEAGLRGRRRFLGRLLLAVGGSLGVALLVPLRSLGPGPKAELFTTSWSRGARLVTNEGHPLRATDVAVDQAITVFPEGATGSADSQAFLIGTRPGMLQRDRLRHETPDDIVCYSKICTHAGCPVGLYRATQGELLCPCHQTTFDVNRGARVLSGPAGRPLPQLPLGVDEDGFLIALDDFSEPVGPSFWNMTDERRAGA